MFRNPAVPNHHTTRIMAFAGAGARDAGKPTHLMSYRCAIREVRIGIDTAVPDKVLKMPACDIRDPSAIPDGAQPYLKLAPVTQSVSVELTYRDGSVSEIKSFRR
jgi:hypothetical protein